MTSDAPTILQRLYAALHRALTAPRIAAMNRHMEEAAKREPRHVLVRHLGVEHLGCWITIPGTPDSARTRQEPSLLLEGGRLVGFMPDVDTARSPSTRVLVILRGAPNLVPVRVDTTVTIAPRDWS